MNDTQPWVQLELEGLEAVRQTLPDGLQRCFFEAPEPIEGPQALQPADFLDSLGLGYRKELPSELSCLQVPRSIFEVDADRMRQRPGAEKTEPAGGEAEPEIR